MHETESLKATIARLRSTLMMATNYRQAVDEAQRILQEAPDTSLNVVKGDAILSACYYTERKLGKSKHIEEMRRVARQIQTKKV